MVLTWVCYICYYTLKMVHFIVGKLYLHQLDLKEKRKSVRREHLHPKENKSFVNETQALWSVGQYVCVIH